MKRDMELVRRILLEVEANEPSGGWATVTPGDVTPDVLGAHIGLLGQAGLLEVEDTRSFGSPNSWMPKRLTWEGHEFLDAIRHDTIWQKLKAKAEEEGGSVPFTILKELGTLYAKKKFGLD